jgi:hypothetical protein
MPAYHCYPIDLAGSITGPAQIFECPHDEAATAHAEALLLGVPFEVWQNTRKVYTTPRSGQGGPGA